MIDVVIDRNGQSQILAFTLSGHAGYAKAGQDIICAAVSAICYTALGYFDTVRFGGKDICYKISDGYMKFNRPDGLSQEENSKADAVLEAMVIGLRQVQTSYGKKYLRIKDS